MGSRVKWAFTALAVVCASACAFAFIGAVGAQEPIFVSPTEGSAGSRFQIVGEVGWTPGETIALSFGFSDAPPGEQYTGALYNEQMVTVLRDGTWSFPAVINEQLLPFPLWRPGFIVVEAEGEQQRVNASLVYTVGEERPIGAPPLAPLGFGPPDMDGTPEQLALRIALLTMGAGALVAASGVLRRN
jgi:hypothetical protein